MSLGRPLRLLPLVALLLGTLSAADADASACAAGAVSDLDARVAQKGFVASNRRSGGGSWGPPAATFPAATPPAGCGAAAWAQARIQGAINRMSAQGFCYCHHHAPWWMPGPRAKSTCNPACAGARPMPNQGADCSNYSAYLYNLAFGQRFTSAIGQQACKPGSAPGVMLPYTTQQQDQFKPGDLLFITQSGVEAAPVRVSHVILWTGYAVDFATSGQPLSWDTLFANVKPKEQPAAQAYVDARRAAGMPVYVISDSHWTGPNLRPFAGWYVSSFSHGRRVIGADALALPSNDAAVAAWDGRDCMSSWALNGRGARGALRAAGAAGGSPYAFSSNDATDGSDDF